METTQALPLHGHIQDLAQDHDIQAALLPVVIAAIKEAKTWRDNYLYDDPRAVSRYERKAEALKRLYRSLYPTSAVDLERVA